MTTYKRKEAARILDVSVATLDRLVTGGKIDSTMVGHSRRFRDAHIEKYLKKNEVICK